MIATTIDPKYVLGRGAYFWRFLLVSLLMGGLDGAMTNPVTGYYEAGAEAAMLFAWGLAVWYMVYISMARCRHIGINVWHSAWCVVPFGWIVLALRNPKDATIVELVRSDPAYAGDRGEPFERSEFDRGEPND